MQQRKSPQIAMIKIPIHKKVSKYVLDGKLLKICTAFFVIN